MVRMYVITGTEIKETGTLSYKFMFDSGAPFTDFASISGQYGLMTLHEKDDNYFDPFKWGEAYNEPDPEKKAALLADAIGPNGTLIWMLNIFKSGKGLLMASGVDDDQENEGLQKMLKEVPDCVMLIHRGLYERVTDVCKKLGIEIDCFHYDGTLMTS